MEVVAIFLGQAVMVFYYQKPQCYTGTSAATFKLYKLFIMLLYINEDV